MPPKQKSIEAPAAEDTAPTAAPAVLSLEKKTASYYKLQRDRLELTVIDLMDQVQTLQAENETLRAQIAATTAPAEGEVNG